MSMRISSIGLTVLALSACSGGSEVANDEGSVPAPAATVAGTSLRSVPCALHGATRYASDCAIESEAADGKTVLIIRHPDGGFRRLVELDGGRSYLAADGADKAVVAVDNGKLAVTVADDGYLLPLPPSSEAAAVAATDAPAR